MRASPVKRDEFWQAFDKGPPTTSRVSTPEALHLEFQAYLPLNTGQILRRARVVTMDAIRQLLTIWTATDAIQAVRLNVHHTFCAIHVVDCQVWQFEGNGLDCSYTPWLERIQAVFSVRYSFLHEMCG